MSLKYADGEQSNFFSKINNLDKGKKQLKNIYFLNNLGLLFSARENVLNNFKNRLFSLKKLGKIPTYEPKPDLAIEPTKYKKSKLKLQQKIYKWWNILELF